MSQRDCLQVSALLNAALMAQQLSALLRTMQLERQVSRH